MHEAGFGERELRARVSVALFFLGVLVLAPGLLLGPPDAKGTAGALRVLAGEVPYRDFWSMYAPGQFWAQALVFRAFGVSYLVQGAACVLVLAAAGVVFHALLVRVGAGRRTALVLWGVFVVAFWRIAPELTSYPPALLLGLLGLERVTAAHRGAGAGVLFAAGLAFGAAAIFKHDVAAYFAVASSIALLARGALAGKWANDAPAERELVSAPGPSAEMGQRALRTESREKSGFAEHAAELEAGRDGARGRWTPPLVALRWLALGCLVTAGPALAWLALVAGKDAWHDLVVFPATDFRLVRSEAYPGLSPDPAPFAALLAGGGEGRDLLLRWRAAGEALREWSLTQLPLVVFAGAVLVLVVRRRSLAPSALAIATTFALGLPLFCAAAHVQQNTHLDSMAILSLLLLAMGLAGARGRVARVALGAGVFLYAGSFLLEASMRVSEFAVLWGEARPLDFPAARGVRFTDARRAEGYAEIVRFVRANVPAGERIHAGVDRHDAVVGNDQNFYVLSGRLPATRYGELHPAVVDREDVQREMIGDLERRGVRCAVLWYFRFGDPEKRLAQRRAVLPGIGATLLDRYLEDEFDEVLRVGRYAVRWRKGAPLPEAR